MNEMDKIAENSKNGTLEKFGIVMMDLNNLKATNDQYGHRYGCHLIIHCGEVLPEIFKTSNEPTMHSIPKSLHSFLTKFSSRVLSSPLKLWFIWTK